MAEVDFLAEVGFLAAVDFFGAEQGEEVVRKSQRLVNRANELS